MVSKGESHLGKFTRKWFGMYRIQYVLFNNTILLMALINFEPNHVLVNINKLKLYKFIEYEVQDFIDTNLLGRTTYNGSIMDKNRA